jgi:alkylhydroperoxidase family enzyme
LRDNLDASDSSLGLHVKALAGLVYATVVESATLAREAREMALRTGFAVKETTLDAIVRFAAEPAGGGDQGDSLESLPGLSRETALALRLAKAVSPSPAMVPAPLVEQISEALSPEAQIELVVWIAVQQMLHRLGSYLAAAG